ncbi:N{2},N{2}-dimethylguanosine tRNA methyltransferase [Geoglobus ahangari]|uniref:tRNA (guanine(26)-N(2))-dimethyltransferase n=1 Tax=Geoglobus ahangari TaxID=113653 RepID=A0A0F7IGY4_9EURY|nr:tRNA (guanine(10)-N(2))-dimethyltransferase [Geoglobus ahangari]AKG92547.1 N{2},N{2}-dimethylguanosine tRNA methyltransferase [Geoglobus ahangari]
MIVEGKARILTEGVFYNPRMEFCRTADMEVFRHLRSKSYLDALAASGVRGIRAMLEAGFENVEFNDIDERAVRVIEENLRLNGLNARVHNRDAVALMRERSYDHIDLDPFGSPAEFIDSAVRSARRFVSVTATDTSALCGSAPISGLRKYGAFAEKTEYYHETGLRMLIGKIVREVTKYDKYAEVLVSWAKEHYYRVHLRVRKSSRMAGKVYEKMGYVLHCNHCGNRVVMSVFETPDRYCSCGGMFRMYGPMWTGELHDPEFVSGLSKEGKAGRLFSAIEQEIDTVTHYDVHNLTERLGISPPKLDDIIEALRSHGFRASRTRFPGPTFKTDASISEIRRIISEIRR